jgi:hypothetical protein
MAVFIAIACSVFSYTLGSPYCRIAKHVSYAVVISDAEKVGVYAVAYISISEELSWGWRHGGEFFFVITLCHFGFVGKGV